VFAGVFAARSTGAGRPFMPLGAVGNVLLVASLTGAVGEELGWRAFLLSRLGHLMSPRNAALAMAVLWALWHLPVFLFADSPYASWPAVPALLTILSFGTLMGALFARAKGSVLATILAHLTLNVLLGVGGAQLSSPALWWTTCVLFGATALALFQWSYVGHDTVAGEVAT